MKIATLPEFGDWLCRWIGGVARFRRGCIVVELEEVRMFF